MSYLNIEDRRTYQRRWRRQWCKDNPELNAFRNQRGAAKRRNIPFLFTLEEWVAWWGEDFDKRGKEPDSLCMARHNDIGAYEIGNVSKISYAQNTIDYQERKAL